MRLERGLLTVRHLIGLMREQRAHPFVQVLLGAVIGVQGDGDVRVLCGDLMRKGRQSQRSGDTIVDADTGEICGRADGHLDNAIGFGVREPFQRGVQRLRAGHVDGRVGVTAASCGVEHFSIAFRSCDRHGFIITRGVPARDQVLGLGEL